MIAYFTPAMRGAKGFRLTGRMSLVLIVLSCVQLLYNPQMNQVISGCVEGILKVSTFCSLSRILAKCCCGGR